MDLEFLQSIMAIVFLLMAIGLSICCYSFIIKMYLRDELEERSIERPPPQRCTNSVRVDLTPSVTVWSVHIPRSMPKDCDTLPPSYEEVMKTYNSNENQSQSPNQSS